jgi:hypothetical protein
LTKTIAAITSPGPSVRKKTLPREYWNKIWGFYEDSGRNHVVAYLLDYDLSDFDPKAPPPKTEAWWHIVNAGLAPEHGPLLDIIERLGNPDVFTLKDIADRASEDLAKFLTDRKNSRSIPYLLEKAGYVALRNPAAKSGLYVIDGERRIVYAKADLAVRDQHIARARKWGK